MSTTGVTSTHQPVRHRGTVPDTPFMPPPGPVSIMPQANSQPLIKIEFALNDPAMTLLRYWSHVPRVGDKVSLDAQPIVDGDYEMPMLVAARVTDVVWKDDGSVEVGLR